MNIVFSRLISLPRFLGTLDVMFDYPKRHKKQQNYVNLPCMPINIPITFRSPQMFHWWTLYCTACSRIFMLSEFSFKCAQWAIGLSVLEKDSLQISLRRVDGNPPVSWTVFLFQSHKDAINVVAEDHGTVYPKKCFSKHYFVFDDGKLWRHALKWFISFNLEARSSALSLDRERSGMRSFNSCWLNSFGSEDVLSGTNWLSEAR